MCKGSTAQVDSIVHNKVFESCFGIAGGTYIKLGVCNGRFIISKMCAYGLKQFDPDNNLL